ncbi:MAG: hypothetical protein KBT00_07050 [Bacteroidales bacterium]|nr:hypothetical protein [Candidatus Cacconaster merdequi]
MTERGTGVKGFAKGKAFVVKDFSVRNPFEGIPPGSILVAPAVSLSDSALIDFKNVTGMVTEEDDPDACLIARGVGIPAVVGILGCTNKIVKGDRVLIRNLDVVVNPDLETVMEFEDLRAQADGQLRFDF